MENQNDKLEIPNNYKPVQNGNSGNAVLPQFFSSEDLAAVNETLTQFKNFFKQNGVYTLNDLISRIAAPKRKRSFLVFKHQRYVTIPIENIAFFYLRNECAILTCFSGVEYSVNYSLDQIQNLLDEKHFFRLNRQYLINFNAIKEVEHYFNRKLFVRLTIPVEEKMLVSKEKSSNFLQWLEER